MDDIYGDDLLDGAPSRSNQPDQAVVEPTPAQTATVPAQLPQTLAEAHAALQEWQDAFLEDRHEHGAFSAVPPHHHVTPTLVATELHRALEAERTSRVEITALRQRLAAAVAESAARTKQDIDLRRELQAARGAGEPSVLQLRQLLLEPAVNREFARVTAAMEAATQEAENLRQQMRAIHVVANDPKGPRVLAAQVRQLEEKCERLVEKASASRAAALERALAAARVQLEDMRRQYGELEDHAHSLDDETESLQRDLLALRRQHAAAVAAAAHAGGPSSAEGPAGGIASGRGPPGGPSGLPVVPPPLPRPSMGGGGGWGRGRGGMQQPPPPQHMPSHRFDRGRGGGGPPPLHPGWRGSGPMAKRPRGQ